MLEGKVAIVTAGAKGIGAATVRRILAEGASVAALDVDAGALAVLAADLPGQKLMTLVIDVADEDAVRQGFADVVKRFGGVDLLHSNAGISGAVGPLHETSPAEFDRMFAVNVRGMFNTIQAVVPLMTARGGGAIVTTASVSGIRPTVGLGAYAASKSAVIAMSRVAAQELGPHNIRVNSVAPGLTDTDGYRRSIPKDGESATSIFATRVQPLGRIGVPDDLANAVVWLMSDQSSYVTGVLLQVDGGYY